MLYVGNSIYTPYKGNYGPAAIYIGSTQIAGWQPQEKTGSELSFTGTYNDKPDLTIYGASIQTETPTPENPVNITSAQDFTVSSNAIQATITEPLRSVVNTDGTLLGRDSIRVYHNQVSLVRECGVQVFDSPNHWRDYSPECVTMDLQFKYVQFAYCTHGTFRQEVKWANSNFIQFNLSHFNVTTLEEWQAYVVQQKEAGTPITVQYVLPEPIEEDITATDLGQALLALSTFYPSTTFSHTSSLPVELHAAVKVQEATDEQL